MTRRAAWPLLPLLALTGPAGAMKHSVDADDIRGVLEEQWAVVAPAGATLEIRYVPALSFDDGVPAIDVQLPDNLSRPGPRALPVSCRVDGRVVSRGLANVVIRGERTVWAARRLLERGDEILPEDLLEETRVFDREPTRLFAWDPSRRWRVVRRVDPGERVTPADVRAVPDVESGDEILLVARAGRSTVSVPGRARQDGDVGDVILVHNSLTGALVRARVVDESSAELVAPAGAGKGKERR